MIRRSVIFAAAFVLPLAAFAQKREVQELQRDVANLIQDVRTLNTNLTQTLTQMNERLQFTYDTAQKTSTNVAVLDNAIRDRIKEQLGAPIAALNTRLDSMTNEFQSLRESVVDVNSRLGKLQAQMEDIANAVKTLQAPPAPPAGTAPGGATTPATGSPQTIPPPGMSAQQLYDSAARDRLGGQLDLAMQGFQQYLQWYPNTELAPNAQFYIGQIHYDRGQWADALKAFDAVLERYSQNNKTPDAMYMKGMTLLRSGQRNEAAREFLNVVQQFPRSEVATKARTQRAALGLSTPATAPTRTRRTR
ncbi:MAG TPA: tol-pal system protein YbgF [Bryobacteraceae bacterium]|nr:tol-pal system protein YbgF [Bryobacteraceae bacterium]